MNTQKMREVKKNANIALFPSLSAKGKAWADSHQVSMSAVASTALKILLAVPLDKKELIIEEALRAAMNAAPSASEAQMMRRIAALEAAVFQENPDKRKKPLTIMDGAASELQRTRK